MQRPKVEMTGYIQETAKLVLLEHTEPEKERWQVILYPPGGHIASKFLYTHLLYLHRIKRVGRAS